MTALEAQLSVRGSEKKIGPVCLSAGAASLPAGEGPLMRPFEMECGSGAARADVTIRTSIAICSNAAVSDLGDQALKRG